MDWFSLALAFLLGSAFALWMKHLRDRQKERDELAREEEDRFDPDARHDIPRR